MTLHNCITSTNLTRNRYVFLLFPSNPTFESQTAVTAATPRFGFDLAKFRETTQLGDPIGGVFFDVAPSSDGGSVTSSGAATGTSKGAGAATPTNGATGLAAHGMMVGIVGLLVMQLLAL